MSLILPITRICIKNVFLFYHWNQALLSSVLSAVLFVWESLIIVWILILCYHVVQIVLSRPLRKLRTKKWLKICRRSPSLTSIPKTTIQLIKLIVYADTKWNPVSWRYDFALKYEAWRSLAEVSRKSVYFDITFSPEKHWHTSGKPTQPSFLKSNQPRAEI